MFLVALVAAFFVVPTATQRETNRPSRHSKVRCRRTFAAAGCTIVANVGNTPPDFAGKHYGRAFRLPNYDGQLG